jgi:hypothetical protein
MLRCIACRPGCLITRRGTSSSERERGQCGLQDSMRWLRILLPSRKKRVIAPGHLTSPPKGGCRTRLVSPISLRAGTSTTPHRRCPTRHPRPGGRLSAIHRRRGRSLGVGIQRGLSKSLPCPVPWAVVARFVCRRAVERTRSATRIPLRDPAVAYVTFFASQDLPSH